MNSTPSGSTVQIQVRQRYSWNRANVPCTDATIATQGLIGDSSLLRCYTGNCALWVDDTTRTSCTDYSVDLVVSSGERLYIQTLNLNTARSVGYVSSAWFADLVVGGNSAWNLITRIDTTVRPDGFINTSPVATTLPVIYKAINVQHVHVVQMSDFDGTDILKCRWSTSTGNVNGYNECSGVCNGVPGAQLFQNNCTLVFTLTQANKYAAVALQIEDYYNSAATTPLSSVSLQFLFYGYTTPGGCSTSPKIIGARPNRGNYQIFHKILRKRNLSFSNDLACIGVDVGQNITEYVIAEIGCAGKIVKDFTSSTPVGMIKSTIQNPSTG